jgi:hypothetical protein
VRLGLGSAFLSESLRVCIPAATFDLVIGEGVFTDDSAQTADAGGSPHTQLFALDREMLQPVGFRVLVVEVEYNPRQSINRIHELFPWNPGTNPTTIS